MKVLFRREIEKALNVPRVFEAIERGFIAYSLGETVIPPVATLHFNSPRGECHIKYGYSNHGNYYVVKVASGFPENPRCGLPSTNGLMLLFDKFTGKPVCALFDEGYLTDIRTAVAGALAAKKLAPKKISAIGIIGTGMQAYYQLKFLEYVTSCRRGFIWGRDRKKAERLVSNDDFKNWMLQPASDLDELTSKCNLIVTTTSSAQPLLFADQIKPGTHITAIGADDLHKQELDPFIFGKAAKIVLDSKSQCAAYGDFCVALKANCINSEKVVELGEMLRSSSYERGKEDITISVLTGLAVQDLAIAESFCKK